MTTGRGLATQTEAFWREVYELSESDKDLVTGLILEAGRPQQLDALVSAIIMHRFRAEKDLAAQQARLGRIYRPVDEYEVGEELVFSALDFLVGRVVAVRSGQNPRYEPFSVIRVSFEEAAPEREFAAPEREFAAGMKQAHPLSRPVEDLLRAHEAEMSEADMARLFGHYVALQLEPALEASDDFVWFNDTWFLRELLPEINVGHLNLAEAMIYEAARPLSAPQMLREPALAATGWVDSQLFALNHSLGQDERFDNVSMTEEPSWYLHALEPEAVLRRPAVLEPAFRARGGEYLGLTMLDLVDEVGDELDDVETMMMREASSIHFEVNYPHLCAGTMPATLQFLRMLPPVDNRHFALTMIEASSDRRFDVWVVPGERYVCGLGDWYASVGMCIGGQVSVTPTDDELTFTLSAPPTRGRRSEWIRSVSIVEGRLVLQMQRASVAVRCDRNMLVHVPDREAVLGLMEHAGDAQLPLRTVIRDVFAELAKLSSRGVVHAKSIYSMANLLRRTAAVSIFAELTRSACYDPVGDGFWAYDPAFEGTVYRTPDEMRERPLSKRDDLIRDQVVQYLGR